MAKCVYCNQNWLHWCERIGDDKQRMSQEMMALYKQEKVNSGWLFTTDYPDAYLPCVVLHADGLC